MDLPEELEKQFQIELKAFEEARQMKYVTTIERMAEERGEERGAKSREVEIALNLLRQGLAIESIAQATGLTIAEIQALQVQET
jgi:predicted transposase YdaD